MKSKTIRLILWAIALNIAQARAQVSVGSEGLFIKGGTLISLEGLGMRPSSDMVLENNSIESKGEVVEWPLFSSVKKLIWFNGVINFSGEMTLNVPASALNGNERDALNIAVAEAKSNDYTDFTILNGGTQSGDLVSNVIAQPYRLDRVTAVNRKIVKPAYPLDISLTTAALNENAPAGSPAGTLSSASYDPNSVFTYSLVSGGGDTDNALFRINGDQLQTNAVLNYENKASYSVLIRSTTEKGLSLDKQFVINLTDVNEQPTLNVIADQSICFTRSPRVITLTGISPGEEASQTTDITVSSSNTALFEVLQVSQAVNGNAELRYVVAEGARGTATVNVMVTDNGGTDHGGQNTRIRSFVLAVNPLPQLSISSDQGQSISRGTTVNLTVSDAVAGSVGYHWEYAEGIIGGQNSSTLQVRPSATATYRVTAISPSGCSSTAEITIEVKEDYALLKGTNILSPNGDGMNDYFMIDNIDLYPNNTLRIYDRAGRELYSKQGYSNDWNGYFNGSPLAEDTYYYIVDFGPGKPKLKGYITIVRD